jgi:gluconate kinase
MPQPSGTSMTDEQRLAWLEALAEAAYDKMYDATNGTEAAARYSDAKEALSDAIGLAHRLGHAKVATRLEARLVHIKAVFRSQFG